MYILLVIVLCCKFEKAVKEYFMIIKELLVDCVLISGFSA